MNGPLISCKTIFFLFACCYISSTYKKSYATGLLQIIPDYFTIRRKPFVACNLHIHRSFVHHFYLLCVNINGPEATDLVQGPFVEKNKNFGMGGEKLKI